MGRGMSETSGARTSTLAEYVGPEYENLGRTGGYSRNRNAMQLSRAFALYTNAVSHVHRSSVHLIPKSTSSPSLLPRIPMPPLIFPCQLQLIPLPNVSHRLIVLLPPEPLLALFGHCEK